MNIMRLSDLQTKPKMFSTFMLCLLAEIYASFPEEGDPDQPKLVIFIDEAHLIFKEASKALLAQLESIIKLIRSKGVGIFFVTQTPVDIPAEILGQLGMKVQHAFRAFTANDRKALKLIAQNYPISNYYEIEVLLTQLGIGEALITVLNEKGIPTPIAHTLLCAPQSRMDVLSLEEINQLVTSSKLTKKYNQIYLKIISTCQKLISYILCFSGFGIFSKLNITKTRATDLTKRLATFWASSTRPGIV